MTSHYQVHFDGFDPSQHRKNALMRAQSKLREQQRREKEAKRRPSE